MAFLLGAASSRALIAKTLDEYSRRRLDVRLNVTSESSCTEIMTKEELNNAKYDLIQKTIGECYKANKRLRPTKTMYGILSYSLVLEDVDYDIRYPLIPQDEDEGEAD